MLEEWLKWPINAGLMPWYSIKRSCSGEMNLLPTSYHSGKSDDLKFVIEEIAKDYESIFLVGFSLGGNILLKYLGEQGSIVLKTN